MLKQRNLVGKTDNFRPIRVFTGKILLKLNTRQQGGRFCRLLYIRNLVCRRPARPLEGISIFVCTYSVLVSLFSEFSSTFLVTELLKLVNLQGLQISFALEEDEVAVICYDKTRATK